MDFPVALQMFSLREMWEANPLAAMRAAKEAGYQGIDFCRKQGGTEWLIVEYTPKDDPVAAVTESLTALRGIMAR